MIWHQANTTTGGPHLHLGDYADGGPPAFKVEDYGRYRTLP